MPKNKIGGNKAKKGKNIIKAAQELYFREADEIYGVVINLLGSRRVNVFCSDGITRICLIKGAMRKKIWIHKGNYVLVSLRACSTNQNNGDIIHKYSDEDVVKLYSFEELNNDMKTIELKSLTGNGNLNSNNKEDLNIVFDYDASDDDKDDIDNI